LQFLTWQTKDLIDRAALEQELWHGWRLTFDMSGMWKRAKPAGTCPLDGRVRRLCERSH
jgi:hypothetical protein